MFDVIWMYSNFIKTAMKNNFVNVHGGIERSIHLCISCFLLLFFICERYNRHVHVIFFVYIFFLDFDALIYYRETLSVNEFCKT